MEAVGETVSLVHEKLRSDPSLAIVFASASYREAMPEVVSAITNFLSPGCLLATVCETVVGGSREISSTPALALWATNQGNIQGVHLNDKATETILSLSGDAEGRKVSEASGSSGSASDSSGSGSSGPASDSPNSPTLLLIADPFSFPTEELLVEIEADRPGLEIIGGLASGANQPGSNQLWLNDECHRDGAIGAVISDISPGGVRTRVSQGCQPVGQPFTVTRAESGLIFELGGRPALQRLRELVTTATPKERELMRRGLHIGIAVDESRLDHYEFLIRGIAGIDQERGAIAVGGRLDVGSTMQFHVRNVQTAAADLRARLEKESAEAALLFTCNGRGANMFGAPDREASLVTRLLGNAPLAGMSCAGEIGPIGNHNFLHGFTASLALFGE